MSLVLWLCGAALAGDTTGYGGMDVMVLGTQGGETFDLAVAFPIGTADDPEGAEGMTHGVEHLWFVASHAGATVGDRYRQLGCDANAWTGPEVMSFALSCPLSALEAVLDLEQARFRPWVLDAQTVTREWRVTEMEQADRLETPEIGERTFLARQLLPATHPVRLRASRPEIGPPPSLSAVQAFIAAHVRPEQAVMVIRGPVAGPSLHALLAARFGPGEARVAVPPRRSALQVRETLRLAPRTVHGIAAEPAVHVAWTLPTTEGLSDYEITLYIDLWLQLQLAADPRALTVSCQGVDVLRVHTVDCRIQARSDADAASLGAELGLRLAGLAKVQEGDWISATAQGQGAVWGIMAAERPGSHPGSLVNAIACDLIGGSTGNAARSARLSDYIRGARLAETALILVLAGDGPPSQTLTPSPPPPAAAPGEHPAAATPPPSDPPLAIQTAVLPNGMVLIGVQRPGSPLLYATLEARLAHEPAALRAAFGARAAVTRDSWRGDMVELDGSGGPSRTLVTVPANAGAAAAVLRQGVAPRPDDPLQAARGLALAAREVEAAQRSGEVWAWSIPAGLLPSAEALRGLDGIAADEISRAALALYSPARTTLVVISDQAPTVALQHFADQFATWSAPDRAAVTTERPHWDPPAAAFVPVPGLRAWVGTGCAAGEDRVAARVFAWVVQERLMREVRERRALTYTPDAFVEEDALHTLVSTDPEQAGEVLRLIQRALAEPVSAVEVEAARAELLRHASPSRWPPDELGHALAAGYIQPQEVVGWSAAVQAVDLAAVTGSAEACAAKVRWTIAGPQTTAVPADAVVVDPATPHAPATP